MEREQSSRLRGQVREREKAGPSAQGTPQMRSFQMGQLLSQCSQDMREQADRVEDALARRVAETEEATRTLEGQLKEVRVISLQRHCT